jgi:hypothetical protein
MIKILQCLDDLKQIISLLILLLIVVIIMTYRIFKFVLTHIFHHFAYFILNNTSHMFPILIFFIYLNLTMRYLYTFEY